LKREDEVRCKLNVYCIHKLITDCKQAGMPDKDIWRDIKECFQSSGDKLEMEVRPIEMLWGDTKKIDELLQAKATERFEERNKTPEGKTRPDG